MTLYVPYRNETVSVNFVVINKPNEGIVEAYQYYSINYDINFLTFYLLPAFHSVSVKRFTSMYVKHTFLWLVDFCSKLLFGLV